MVVGPENPTVRSKMTLPDNKWPAQDGRCIELPSGLCYYRTVGRGKPPVVLLHGLANDSRIYGRLQQLLGRSTRTLAPDLLGWGRSKPNDGLEFGFDTIDRNVQQFLDACDLDDLVLVGHEMTGPAAIRWAAAHPARARGLVLLNTYYGWNSARMPPILKVLHAPLAGPVLRRVIDVGKPALARHLFRWQIGRLWGRRTEMSDQLTRMFHEMFSESALARRAFHRINDQLVSQIDANQRRLDLLATLQCPTLVLWGSRDPYLRPHVARQFHRLIPNSHLTLLPESGHFVQVEDAEAVSEAITRFIRGISAG